MVTYIRSDLEFILEQIKIAEAHALWTQGDPSGRPLFGPDPDGAGPLQGGSIPSYNVSWGLRTVNGTYNHLLPGTENTGAADQPFPTLLDPVYRDADGGLLDPDGPGPAPEFPTQDNYNPSDDPNSVVIDSSLRTISNLLVDQTLSNPVAIIVALQRNGIEGDLIALAQTIKAEYELVAPLFKAVDDATDAYSEAQAAADAANPPDGALDAAAAAALAALTAAEGALTDARGPLDALLVPNGIELNGANVQLPNIAPDEGLSAPFNSWFTLFGQFFDHGLDLVAKGGSGTVFIPLQTDDPLYDPTPGAPNFMVLTRATVGAGEDGVMGTADDVRPINNTTPFVDQNQTYSSHSSHQVFLRQYELNAAGDPVATGKLIEGGNGGMATWADLKAQAATLLGIQLLDVDVGNIPLLATDEYGNFLPGANGYPQIVMAGLNPGDPPFLVEGDPAANGGLGVLVDGAVRTGHAFLADIAHNAVPDGLEDGDTEVGGNIPADGEYDDELLDAHFMAGDGRANENIGLTAVHHVFHSEHNRLVEHTKEVVLATGDAAFIAEWQLPDGSWDGERLFQAAKFGTEMQYQHLVFEEFARKIQPNINVFLVPDGFDVTLDPAIVAEFAHVVYRFGHSMLTESIDRFDTGFNADHISLIQGFLNPLQFENNGGNTVVDADIAAGDIIRGMTRQAGNQIDEFVTSALRNNLLGLPLDLATINLARGRDTGVPSLNAARAEFYAASNENELLKPYESWVDFAAHLKNEASIINFVAAYGTHSLITGQTTIEGKRDAALTIITGVSTGGLLVPADRLDFLGATGAYAGGSLGGLNNVDLWIGGLAEQTMPFGGMLGSTFNFVFEVQMENLQSGDRFYYLQRLDGLHLFGEMEANSFAAMIMRNTDATHLPSDVFSTPGLILEVDRSLQFNDLNGDGILESDDPLGSGILTPLISRDNPGTAGTDSNYLRYTGGDHVVMGGTDNADIIIAGIGDDTIHGDGGNDLLEGGFGNDIINGGAGDDIIKDIGGDDNIKGGDGNDVIHAGPGLDLILGGRGQDFVFLGTDMGSEVFAGEGDDFIYGNKNAERILGNEGSDWIETGTFDGAPGDNFDEVFSRDGIDGHDVFLGDGGFDEFIGEGGDDIMVGSAGRGKMVGMSGFDWATYKDNTTGVNADLSIPIVFDEAPVIPGNAALDEYETVEGLSGTAFDDILRGTNDTAAEMLPTTQGGSGGYRGSALDADGIARIDGLQEVLGALDSFAAGDIILGGDGSDVIEGQGGDDIIDGDKYLNVRIGVYANNDGTGALLDSADSMTELSSRMFSGALNPGQLKIIREIVDTGGVGDVDIAVFSGDLADYDITNNGDGTTTVAHARGTATDGTDTLRNIERLRFADQEIAINTPATGVPVISDARPTEGQTLTTNTAGIADANGTGPYSYQWQSSANGTTWTNIAGATGANFTPDNNLLTSFGDQAGLQLRVVVSFTDGGGTGEVVTSAATGPVGVDWDGVPFLNSTLNGTEGDDIGNGTSPIIFGGNDTLNGNGGNDILNGVGGTDTINGGAGNDTIDGGTGADTINGGAGNDLITQVSTAGRDFVDGGADVDTFQLNGVAGGETFTIYTRAAWDAVGTNNLASLNANTEVVITRNGSNFASVIAELDNIEEIRINTRLVTSPAPGGGPGGAGGGDTVAVVGNFTGTSLNFNTITVNGGEGGDTIDMSGLESDHRIVFKALGGNDVILGTLRPQDVIEVPAGSVLANYVFTTGPSGATVASNGTHTITFTSVGGLPVFRVATADEAAGAVVGEPEYDASGNDTIVGSDGDDLIAGAGGADTASGGLGDDWYYVDNFGDVVIDGVGQGILDRVFAGASYTLTAGSEIEILSTDWHAGTGAINLSGNELTNVIYGNEGANILDGSNGNDMLDGRGGDDLLFGGAGVDVTYGGTGNDTHFVENALDRVVESVGAGSSDRVYAGTSYALTAGSEVEILSTDWHAGTAAINLSGNDFDNAIYGNEGSNIIDGSGGNDTVDGRGGNDILFGSAGVDISIGGTGDDWHFVESAGDQVVEGAGEGTADRVFTSVSYALAAGVEVEILSTDHNAGTGAINLTGNAFSNAIYGNEGANVIDGGGGNDAVDARGGDDTIVQTGAAGGRTFIDGGSGMDTYQLNGSAGAETFVIYSRAAAVSAIAGLTLASDSTEIVVTRDGQVIAELDNVEEININALNVSSPGGALPGGNGGNGGDTIEVIGDFNPTSLNFNTITVNGGRGNDTVDISGLTSDHRLFFNTGGGADQVIGNTRPQDVINYTNGNGNGGGNSNGGGSLHQQDNPMQLIRAQIDDWMDLHHGRFGSLREARHFIDSDYPFA
ncbi:MAG: heme peroxidase [Sphingomonadales bacterium]|nr:MAG: heme peroxidase [Sphingomonadales bacterium]